MHQAVRPYAAAGVALVGALAALGFSAATVHADWQVVTIGPEMNVTYGDNPWLDQQTYYMDCSLLNAPDEAFETVVHNDTSIFGPSFFSNWNMTVVQDISGNVPVGEQDNGFYFAGVDLIYHSIGVTPEAYFFVPLFGDIYFPTSFVEAVGPTFFEPAMWLGLL